MPGAVGIRVRPSGPVWQPGSGAGGGEGAAAQAGGGAQQIHEASTLHIPPIEVQMKDGSGGILSSHFYPVTSVTVHPGVGRSALVYALAPAAGLASPGAQ